MQTTWSLISLVFIFGVFWFFLIRPQQKRQKEHNELISNLRTGDKVVTIGGIFGTITALNEETVTLKVADDTQLILRRSAIGQSQRNQAEQRQGD